MENQFGTVSKLHLVAAKRGDRTILEDVSFTAPYKVMRPLYEKADVMTVMILVASAGIMSGDRQEFDIHVREQANMEVVSQAYEKIHRMPDGYASRETHLAVDSNARLAYTPLPTIPFGESDYRSKLCVELADESSRFVLSEVLTCGRVAHGEQFAYRNFQNEVTIYQKGHLVYRDHTCYRPEQMNMTGDGMYEGFTHLANLVICNEPKSEAWISKVREILDETPQMEGGVTRTTAGHVAVKILGTSGQKLTDMLEQILNLNEE